MGCAVSKRCDELREETRALRAKIHALEGEVWEARRERDREARARGRREAAFTAKKVEWRRESQRHREEVGELQKRLGEEAARRRALEEEYNSAIEAAAGNSGGGDWVARELQRASAWALVEQMKAEQAQREQAVEKWKQLYLAIKAELDALILRTKQGEGHLTLSHSCMDDMLTPCKEQLELDALLGPRELFLALVSDR
ncbi:hypothetical protein Taro_042168 [Colocasia esculenta]|uniref:Uncharacterized protein n=1 Tax=Colocasia esculenta TaxID=4460 RepID=A0A843WHQ3_COLES|nr:hypothetical protein [Colocasia esculenta]